MPKLAKIPMGEITVQDVANVLEPIWNTKRETASRLRGRMENIISRAIAMGLRADANPATRMLIASVLGKQTKAVQQQPAVRGPMHLRSGPI